MYVGHFPHQFTQLDVGVAIFFVISGFVLYRPFARRILRNEPEPAIIPFLARRAARIFPAYWLALTVMIVVGKLSHGKLLGLLVYPKHRIGYLPYYLLMHIYRNKDEAQGGINQAWTLAAEIAFYLFVPLFAFAARRLTQRASVRRRYNAQFVLLGLVFATSIGFRSYCYWGSSARLNAVGEYWLFANLDLFAIGMALAVATVGVTIGIGDGRCVATLRALPELWWALAIGVFWWSSYRLGIGISPRPTKWDGLFKQEMHGLVALLIVVPCVFPGGRRNVVSALLRWKPVVFGGLVSYGVYLWHQAWLVQASRWQYDTIQKATGIRPQPFTASMPLILIFGLFVATLTAAVSWYGFEQPIMRRVGVKRSVRATEHRVGND